MAVAACVLLCPVDPDNTALFCGVLTADDETSADVAALDDSDQRSVAVIWVATAVGGCAAKLVMVVHSQCLYRRPMLRQQQHHCC